MYIVQNVIEIQSLLNCTYRENDIYMEIALMKNSEKNEDGSSSVVDEIICVQ